VFLCAGLIGLHQSSAALADSEPTPQTMTATELVARIAAGQPVQLEGTTIVGDLHLDGVETVRRVVRCTDCIFTGSIIGSNVIFDRVVDISGARVDGSIDFGGAAFHDAFLMGRTGTRSSIITGQVSFVLAAFEGRASFEGGRFGGDADFRLAQFFGDALFADAEVVGAARFNSTVFKARADFASAPAATSAEDNPSDLGGSPPLDLGCPAGTRHAFEGPTNFSAAAFAEKADFRQRCFGGPVTFAGATFGSADFSLVVFRKGAVFDDSSVDGVASFRVATFNRDLSFQHVVLRGPTDFEAATFDQSVEMFGTSAADSLSLDRVLVGGSIGLDKVQANGFQMSLSYLARISSEPVRERVLSMVEASARARGDLALANEAVFIKSSMETASTTGLPHWEGLAAEQIGGYLVKPFYPLRAFVFLLLIGTAVRSAAPVLARSFARTVARVRAPSTSIRGAMRMPNRAASARTKMSSSATAFYRHVVSLRPSRARTMKAGRAAAGFVNAVLKRAGMAALTVTRAASGSIHAAGNARPKDIESGEVRLTQYFAVLIAGSEWLAFKVLIGLFLIGLANSNPTFKQIVESVTR